MSHHPKHVFVDANVWIGMGQGFKKAEASTLEELVEHGLIKVISTDLTITEVTKHFRNSDVERLEPLTKGELSKAAKQLMGIDIPVLDRETLRSTFFARHRKLVSLQMITRMKAEIRSIDSVKPNHVLSQYTEGTGLFGASAKKNQFPDAFVFAAISSDVSAEKPLIIWSLDGDFTQACEQHPHIAQVKTMPKLLNALGIAPEGASMIELLEERPDLFEVPLEDAIVGESVEARDVDDADVEVLGIERVRDVTVTSLYRVNGEANQYIGFGRCEPEALIHFTAPDWDTAVYDSEDKVRIPLESVEGEVEVELDEFGFSFLAIIKENQVESIQNLQLSDLSVLSTVIASDDYR